MASLFFDFNQIERPHKKIKIMFTSIHSQAHHFIISLDTLKLHNKWTSPLEGVYPATVDGQLS
jgi:hypothetical protein